MDRDGSDGSLLGECFDLLVALYDQDGDHEILKEVFHLSAGNTILVVFLTGLDTVEPTKMDMSQIDLVGLLVFVCLFGNGFKKTHIDGPAWSLSARFKGY